MFRSFAGLVALTMITAGSPPLLGNDTTAEIALGGLTLKRSESIRMDTEDLYISEKLVRVRYHFTNTSDQPIDTLIAFSLPDVPPDSDDLENFWSDLSELNFKTKVDGKPISFKIIQQAIYKGEDVSSRLEALKIPLNPRSRIMDDAIMIVPESERDRLVLDGLLEDSVGFPRYHPNWSLRTSVTRKQVFPANATVAVEHEYDPLVGGSVAGGLEASARNTQWFREKQRKYCIDKDWLAGFDRGAKKSKRGGAYEESFLSYVLKTGANWKGPIGEFRLIVDKGKPENLVSFCAEGVKKISTTQFEVRKTHFTPKTDLHILIVEWLQ